MIVLRSAVANGFNLDTFSVHFMRSLNGYILKPLATGVEQKNLIYRVLMIFFSFFFLNLKFNFVFLFKEIHLSRSHTTIINFNSYNKYSNSDNHLT